MFVHGGNWRLTEGACSDISKTAVGCFSSFLVFLSNSPNPGIKPNELYMAKLKTSSTIEMCIFIYFMPVIYGDNANVRSDTCRVQKDPGLKNKK